MQYEYACNKCQQVFEVNQKLADKPFEKHKQLPGQLTSKCKGTLRKLISLSSFSLKGSCWARDGYK